MEVDPAEIDFRSARPRGYQGTARSGVIEQIDADWEQALQSARELDK